MPLTAQYGSLPFAEAIDFLKRKVNLPTRRHEDLMGAAHSRAFVVAGATKAELLCDLHGMVVQAIQGKSDLAWFRKGFDAVVKKHGWNYRGERGWRTATILNTNLSVAYSAGREKQRRDPAILKEFPYDRYRTMDDGRVRLEHKSWNNTVLPSGDPWWEKHTPPNGWGCRCWKEPVAGSERAALVGQGARTEAPDNGTYEYENPSTGEVSQVPVGIDPGWDYNPGGAAWGSDYTKMLANESDYGTWNSLSKQGPEMYGRGAVPADEPKATLLPIAKTEAELRERLRAGIGGDSVILKNPAGESISLNQGIIDHILEKTEGRWNGREQYFSFLPELITDPYEIWLGFEQCAETGRVRIRQRYVKELRLAKNKTLGLVAHITNNRWTGLTTFVGKSTAQNNLRIGRLLWGR
ncbi:MAG: hypothetical protein JW699_07720 [Chitinispirillaceae bacterium]|nr:hypothetical protein [Chitinispirillaceae bacterium]